KFSRIFNSRDVIFKENTFLPTYSFNIPDLQGKFYVNGIDEIIDISDLPISTVPQPPAYRPSPPQIESSTPTTPSTHSMPQHPFYPIPPSPHPHPTDDSDDDEELQNTSTTATPSETPNISVPTTSTISAQEQPRSISPTRELPLEQLPTLEEVQQAFQQEQQPIKQA